MRAKNKPRQWMQIYRGAGVHKDFIYLNGTMYTDTDEPLRIAYLKGSRFKGATNGTTMRVFISGKHGGGVMISSYQTSAIWKPVCDRLSFLKAWEIFESYVRML